MWFNMNQCFWSKKEIQEAEKKANFTILKEKEAPQGHLFIKITKDLDLKIPKNLKFDHGFCGGDYCLLANDTECKLLGANINYWEHCADWYIVLVDKDLDK